MPYLKVKRGEVLNASGERVLNFHLEREITTIGRGKNNDIQLAGTKKVSRYHAAIIKLKDPPNLINSHFIRDLGSLHFTRVNGNIVFRKQLKEGDVIEIEDFRIEYSRSQLPVRKECPIEILDTPLQNLTKIISNGSTDESTVFLTNYPYEDYIASLPLPRQLALLDLLSLIKQAENLPSLLEKALELISNIVTAQTGFIALVREDNKLAEYATGKRGDRFQIDKGLIDQLMQGRYYHNSSTIAIPIRVIDRVLGFIYLRGELREALKKQDIDLLHIIANSMGKRVEEIRSGKRIKKEKDQTDRVFEWPVNIIAHSKKMSEIYAQIKKIAPADIDILILGETGSGKELVAEEIHRLSPRAGKSYVIVDCAKLHDPIHAQSELFGHKKGAFTGATTDRRGAFQLADKGTVYLDEIGEISPDIQKELLRVLETKAIKPLGSDKTISVDVRVIAATNRNLQGYVKEGGFREDLYYRLNKGVVISIPPLRERVEDIPLLAHFFVDKYVRKHSRNIKGISHGAMRILMEYPWPGNIRELEGYIERAIVAAPEEKELLFLWDLPTKSQEAVLEKKGGEEKLRTLRELEREEIERVLASTNRNITKTAKVLGITRPTLYKKIKEYGIQV